MNNNVNNKNNNSNPPSNNKINFDNGLLGFANDVRNGRLLNKLNNRRGSGLDKPNNDNNSINNPNLKQYNRLAGTPNQVRSASNNNLSSSRDDKLNDSSTVNKDNKNRNSKSDNNSSKSSSTKKASNGFGSKLGSINKNDLNNIRKDPGQAKDIAVEVAKDAVKKKVITWVVGASIGCLPFLLIFIIFIVIITVIISAAGGNNDTGSSFTPYGNECGFTLRATTLSKEEFRTRLEDYAKNTSYNKNYYQLFADNANNIYDIATSHNVNPELVVTRAVSEGFDPGEGNNYWGINCTNTGGGKDCKSYSSFSKGVEAFINTTNNDSTLADFMRHYSYIGEYWYNPGGSGLGGCYYAKYIYNDSNMPSHVKSACSSSASKCYKGGGSGCVKTTKEDQDAYTTWQVSQMTSHRVKVFGEVDNNSCISSSSSGNTGVDNFISLSDDEVWKALTGTSTNYNKISESEMNKRVTTISVPIRVWSSTKKNDYSTKKVEASITVNSALAPVFTAFFNEVYNKTPDFVINKSELYCYNYRARKSGRSLSAHAYGAACDINPSTKGNGYNQTVYTKETWNKLPNSKEKMQIIYKGSKVVEIAHKYTLSWGGEWNSVTDAMHFSFIGDVSRSSLQNKNSGG